MPASHRPTRSSSTVGIQPDQSRVRVTDRGPGFTRPMFDEPPSGTGDRGLYLVDALADRWGAEPTPRGDGWWSGSSSTSNERPTARLAAPPPGAASGQQLLPHRRRLERSQTECTAPAPAAPRNLEMPS